ncbi:SatD family protein, partial [Nocardioides sp.]|uniref:SatD family protein n=1 Tax=Nocardioides sp. TaxID=35761 RepID=UPI0027340C70
MAARYTLIGDLVGSRELTDRAGVQRMLGEVLTEVSERLAPDQELEATVGDEFQGAFVGLSDAVLASLLVRLRMLPVVDVRCGLGHGEVTVHDSSRRPLLQDGPGWWAARDALDVLAAPRRGAERTWYAGPAAGRVNAFLLTRDALVDRLSDRGRRLL